MVKAHFRNESTIQAALNQLAHIGDSEPLTVHQGTVSIPEGTLAQAGRPL